jgi:hypothetical protein
LRLILNFAKTDCPYNSPSLPARLFFPGTRAVETVLTTLPSSSETERLLLVLVQSAEATSRIELRQQSFSKSIGWFTQSTVHLEPSQVASLRNALGITGGKSASRLPREFSTVTPAAWQPRVVHADSA